MSDEEWDLEHEHVCGFIRHFVDEPIYNLISHETHARTMWQTLESLYTSKSRGDKLYMLKNFVELKYKDVTPFTEHLSEFQGHYDQLSAAIINFDDDMLGLFLLITLHDSWETFQVSMISATPNGIVPLQMAKTSALNKEMRMKVLGTFFQLEVIVTENRGRNWKKKKNNGRDNSRSKSRSWYKNVECHYCHEQSISRGIVFYGRRRENTKMVSKKRRIMMMIV